MNQELAVDFMMEVITQTKAQLNKVIKDNPQMESAHGELMAIGMTLCTTTTTEVVCERYQLDYESTTKDIMRRIDIEDAKSNLATKGHEGSVN